MKKFTKIISLVLSLLMVLAFAGCNDPTPKGELDFKTVYERAVELGYEGTLEELIEMFKGDAGISGADGATWHTGDGAPASTLGNDGDFYLDIAAFDVYLKGSGNWFLIKNIIGPKGDTGENGKDGATWTMGVAAPSNSNGKDGDLYLNALTGDIYVKVEGTWVEMGNLKGPQGNTGDNGKSAYELVVEKGYTGTIDEWLTSLIGAGGTNGEDGKSAYELAVEKGYTGTLNEWLASLIGSNGINGKSAYEMAVAYGFSGTEAEWLASLIGAPGVPGKSAYEIYLKYHPEYEGSEEQWMDDLVNGRLADKEEEPPTEGLKYTLNSGKQSYSVSKGSASNEERIVIPYVYDGKPVTIIGYEAFMDCRLNSIKIPDSVEIIDYRAFRNCVNLTSIKIPNSITNIGGDSLGGAAFHGCTSLESINIPNGVTSIRQRTFFNCVALKTVSFGKNSGLKTIENSAFYACTSLESIKIPDGVTSIGMSAFTDTGILNNAPNGVLYVDKWAVSRKGTLSDNLTLKPDTVGIADEVFSFYSVLTHVTIPEGVKFIGDNAFYHCENLTSIVIPASMTRIGNKAFSGGYDIWIGEPWPPFISKLAKVFYGGTDVEWHSNSLFIGYLNEPLYANGHLYYYSEAQPQPMGQYWRWVDGVPTVW